jgi:hypothetical protein
MLVDPEQDLDRTSGTDSSTRHPTAYRDCDRCQGRIQQVRLLGELTRFVTAALRRLGWLAPL